MSLSLSQISFSLTVLATTYLIRYTSQDPSPPKATPGPKHESTPGDKSPSSPNHHAPEQSDAREIKTDSLMTAYFYITPARNINLITLIGIAHAMFPLLPEGKREALCPNYDSDKAGPSSTFLTWNTYTISTFLFLWISLLLRIAAYRSLGSSFTFSITKPTSGLKTTGVHRLIRHPSYTGVFGITIGILLLFLRTRGLMGCFVANGVVGMAIEGCFWVWAVVLVPAIFWVRVKEEEAFLAEVFGGEWGRYVQRTWMFVPGFL